MQTVRFVKQREFQKGTSIQFPKAVNRKTTCGLSPEHTQEPIAKKKLQGLQEESTSANFLPACQSDSYFCKR